MTVVRRARQAPQRERLERETRQEQQDAARIHDVEGADECGRRDAGRRADSDGSLSAPAPHPRPHRAWPRCPREPAGVTSGPAFDARATGMRICTRGSAATAIGSASSAADRERPQQMTRGRGGAAPRRSARMATASRPDALTRMSIAVTSSLASLFAAALQQRAQALVFLVRQPSPLMSSSAAAADPGELSKNVRTSCVSADRLASSGRRSREVDEPRAVVFAGEQARGRS